MVFELNLLRGYFECINRYCCGFICLAGDVNRMTFVATGFIRIGEVESVSPRAAQAPHLTSHSLSVTQIRWTEINLRPRIS